MTLTLYEMKKILIITPYVPYPLNSGGNQAMFSMVDYLRKTYDITMIVPVYEWDRKNYEKLTRIWDDVKFNPYFRIRDKEYKDTSVLCGTSIYFKIISKLMASAARKRMRWLNKNMSEIISDESRFKYHSGLFSEMGMQTEGFMRHVREVAASGGFDLIQVEFYNFTPFKFLLPKDVMTLYVQHEIQFVRLANEMSLFHKVTMTDRYLYERKKLEDIAILNQDDHIITLTDTDKKILSEYIPAEKIDVSPAIIRDKRNASEFTECAKEFVFVGGCDHFPNFDGISWFCSNIIPVLKARGEKFRLYVVGSWKKRFVKKYMKLHPELEFTGYIEDLASFINGKISIVPIRIGSGMRIKIIEAIYAKSPFIATSKGAEGLDFRNGEDCIIADRPEAFADGMMRLAEDVSMQRRLAENAFARISTFSKPEQLKERRAELYRKYFQEQGI